jgi:DNA-binding IclR family transcriptional regulator
MGQFVPVRFRGRILEVYGAYKAGCRTSREASEATGIRPADCRYYTHRLVKCGWLRRIGEEIGRGGAAGIYKPA